jgi:XRE family transcriptional regulator, fatty acid utilization regulator
VVDDDDDVPDPLVLGRRVRHLRRETGLTLDELGARIGVAASVLSRVENGRREPRLGMLNDLAKAFGVPVSELLSTVPPSHRAALEVELDQAQHRPGFQQLGLPRVEISRALPMPVLEQLVGLHRELLRRDLEAVATPGEARRANTQIRLERQARHNYLPDIERLAEDLVQQIGYVRGALTHHQVGEMAGRLGFRIVHVDDLPSSTRSVTDLSHGLIYLPPASIPGGLGLRSLALQAMAHRVLGHDRPRSYDEFLRQRMETTYFAQCALMPETVLVDLLRERQQAKDLAIADLRDAFGVTHETAAQRFTSMATVHLGIPVHFLRVGGDGAIYRGYANDGLVLPTDVTGAIEGQPVCRHWGVRRMLTRRDRPSEAYQYTDTGTGTFWCATQAGSGEKGAMAIAVGVPYAHSRWFRGRDTHEHRRSTCPDDSCCRRAPAEATSRWADQVWPSARIHRQVFSALPSGAFPGVDTRDVYEFLDRRGGAPEQT